MSIVIILMPHLTGTGLIEAIVTNRQKKRERERENNKSERQGDSCARDARQIPHLHP